jgi:hypothetical protein
MQDLQGRIVEACPAPACPDGCAGGLSDCFARLKIKRITSCARSEPVRGSPAPAYPRSADAGFPDRAVPGDGGRQGRHRSGRRVRPPPAHPRGPAARRGARPGRVLERQLQGRARHRRRRQGRDDLPAGPRDRPGRHGGPRGRGRPGPRDARRRARIRDRRRPARRIRALRPAPRAVGGRTAARRQHPRGDGDRHRRVHRRAERGPDRGPRRPARRRSRAGDRGERRGGQRRGEPAGRPRLRGGRLERQAGRGRAAAPPRGRRGPRPLGTVRRRRPAAGQAAVGGRRRLRGRPDAGERAGGDLLRRPGRGERAHRRRRAARHRAALHPARRHPRGDRLGPGADRTPPGPVAAAGHRPAPVRPGRTHHGGRAGRCRSGTGTHPRGRRDRPHRRQRHRSR